VGAAVPLRVVCVAAQVVKHGACLGLGLAAMGAGSEGHYELVNRTMNSLDSAVVGEAAGITIGLLLLGRLGEPIAETAVRASSGCPDDALPNPNPAEDALPRPRCGCLGASGWAADGPERARGCERGGGTLVRVGLPAAVRPALHVRRSLSAWLSPTKPSMRRSSVASALVWP
jgi:hypothetical protein